jgi:hypothetical protein
LDDLNFLKEKNKNNEDLNHTVKETENNVLWHSFDEIINDNNDEDKIENNSLETIETLNYEILSEESKTPIPIYETMSEIELNLSLFLLKI